MTQPHQVETIEFDGLKAPIHRTEFNETYIALQPPDAAPYIVTSSTQKPEEIIAFMNERIGIIRELRADMLKRFEKSSSMKCRYQTGDIVHLFGRPFMLRTFSLAETKKTKKATRGRANVKATIRNDVSIIDLFLIQVNSYDQGRLAFLSFAKPLFTQNALNIVRQSTACVFPEINAVKNVRIRPMRNDWVHLDTKHDTVWFSENLIPYPPDCLAYAYLEALINEQAPDASEEEFKTLIVNGLPNWEQARAQLLEKNSRFAQQ